MTRAKKLLLVFASIALLTQIPFAYRRYRLGQLNSRMQMLNTERRITTTDQSWTEYQGVMHVHSFLGGHSSGSFQDIVAAAQANKLNFVVMTEHTEAQIDTSAFTLKGTHGGVLFINGNEVRSASGDRLLSIPGDGSLSGSDRLTTAEISQQSRDRGSLSLIAYPEEFQHWEGKYDGVEIYNVFTNARRINRLTAFFDAIWSHRSYPDLIFANYYLRPTEALKKWDEQLTRGSKLVGTAGNDSHANIGFSLNDSSGQRIVGLELDPYATSFHLVRVHVLVPRNTPLEENALKDALRFGHCFIGFDLFGDTSGFRFEARNSGRSVIQGDEIPLQSDTRLSVALPIPARLLVFKNGEVIADENSVTTKEIPVGVTGVYRVEVYLPQLGGGVGNQPWIVSNPIYVK